MNVKVVLLMLTINIFSSGANSSSVGSVTVCPCNDTKGCGDFARECCSGMFRLCCARNPDPEREPIAPLAKSKEKLDAAQSARNHEEIYTPPVAPRVARNHIGHSFGDVEGGVDADFGIKSKQVGGGPTGGPTFSAGHTFGGVKGGLRGNFSVKLSS